MNIKIVDVLDAHLLEDAWKLYHEAFRELNALTVQRHLMYRTEFDDVMTDPRIHKYMCLDDEGELCGMSTYTNALDAMPLISPQYFERRWPEHYAENRVWYCGFVAVSPTGRAVNAFAELVEGMYRTAAVENGIIALDMCRFNETKLHMGRVVPLMLHRLSGGVRTERMDEQSYWLYEFPSAA